MRGLQSLTLKFGIDNFRQFETDVAAGKLDTLAEEALQDLRGCTDL